MRKPKNGEYITAVILAAGNGLRMRSTFKQFLKLNGKPILFYSIDVFKRCPFVNNILVVAPLDKISYVRRLLQTTYGRNIEVIAGGATRRISSYNALKFIREKRHGCTYVIFHDGVRPLLSTEMVTTVVDEARKHGAAVLTSQALNVIAQIEGNKIQRAFNANTVHNTQTPHCYRFDWILEAHESEINKKSGREAHENIELVAAVGKKIRAVDWFYRNMKLTFPQDIVALEALLKHIRTDDFYSLSSH